MKFAEFLIYALLVAAVVANPVSISDNNIGDIITVGIKANLEISNKVEQNIISIIVALLNQELGIIRLPGGPEAPNLPHPEFASISPDMRDQIRELLQKYRERQ